MRMSAAAILSFFAVLAINPARAQAPGNLAAAKQTRPAIGCPSLANLRILLGRTSDDPAAAAALLADEKADHLSCVVLGREKVTAISDHAAFAGRAYDCVGLEGTSVCHWTIAGTVVPADPARASQPRKAPATPEKGRR